MFKSNIKPEKRLLWKKADYNLKYWQKLTPHHSKL